MAEEPILQLAQEEEIQLQVDGGADIPLQLDVGEDITLDMDGGGEIALDMDGIPGEYSLTIDGAYVEVPLYDGEYVVIPRLAEQGLATKRKLMEQDVTVRPIPVVYTSNPYNGKTVVIG